MEKEITSEPYQWKEEYSVHVTKIDDGHKKFLEIINDLKKLIALGPDKNEISRIFFTLVQFAEDYLLQEEIYLAECGYPRFQQHKEQHKEFFNQIIKFQRAYESGDERIIREMFMFLEKWFDNHILKYDKSAIELLREKGLN